MLDQYLRCFSMSSVNMFPILQNGWTQVPRTLSQCVHDILFCVNIYIYTYIVFQKHTDTQQHFTYLPSRFQDPRRAAQRVGYPESTGLISPKLAGPMGPGVFYGKHVFSRNRILGGKKWNQLYLPRREITERRCIRLQVDSKTWRPLTYT